MSDSKINSNPDKHNLKMFSYFLFSLFILFLILAFTERLNELFWVAGIMIVALAFLNVGVLIGMEIKDKEKVAKRE